MKKFKIIIPEENYDILNFNTDDLPGVAVVNSSLKKFKDKDVFAYHCSIKIDFENLIKNGMPSEKEIKVVEKFGNHLDGLIKGMIEKPNALFLARITWNSTQEIIYRIHNPEITHILLSEIINKQDYPRDFSFEMELDEEWKLADWHLTDW